jgi:hypothetical protein
MRGLARMRRDDADGVLGKFPGRNPVERGGVHDDRQFGFEPQFAREQFHFIRQIRPGKAAADQEGGGGLWKICFRLPDADHGGLQLRRDDGINLLLREQRDESGLRALRRVRGEHRRAVKSKTARDNRQMPERTFVSGDGAARRETLKILRLRPVQFRFNRAGNQTNVLRDFQPPDKRPCGLREHPDFRCADGERDCRFNRRTEMFAGVGVQAGRNVNGQDGDFRFVDAFGLI